MRLRFDGSFHGGSGGAGAVITSNSGTVQWHGASFLSGCATSAHAEFEGLILGLSAAEHLRPSASLLIEGDCRVVVGQPVSIPHLSPPPSLTYLSPPLLTHYSVDRHPPPQLAQISGKARARKLSKSKARAEEVMSRLSAKSQLTFGSIPREENEHADALSRAAIDAMQALYAASVLACTRASQVQSALSRIEQAARLRVVLPPHVYAELLEACHASREWNALLSAYRAAEQQNAIAGSGEEGRERAFVLASDALEAMGGTSRGSDHASRQLARLRRTHGEAQRAQAAAKRRQATRLLRIDSTASIDMAQVDARRGAAALARGASAARWRAQLVHEAGGLAALRGNDINAVPRLLAVADRLRTEGLSWSADDEEAPSLAEDFEFADLSQRKHRGE